MIKETDDTVHYYSDTLIHKLEQAFNSDVTLILAPAGYGKTTAIRDLMKRMEQKENLKAEWITASSEMDEKIQFRILSTFEKIDSYNNKEIKTILIIDNAELLHEKFLKMIWQGIEKRSRIPIQIMLISNDEKYQWLGSTSDLFRIVRDDLILRPDHIKNYFELANLYISYEDATRLYEYTDGWIAAVYLQQLSYKRTGDILHAKAATLLMKSVVWDALSTQEKELLLAIAPFRKVSAEQIAYIFDLEEIPQEMFQLLGRIPFIWKQDTPLRYEIHPILQELLKERLTEGNEDKRKEIELRAGDCFKESGQLEDAVCLFWKNRDYERILATDIRELSCESCKDIRFGRMAEDVLQNCPDSLIAKYPEQILILIKNLCGRDVREQQKEYMQHLFSVFSKMNLKEEEKNHLLGEWMLVHAITLFPDMDAMLHEMNDAAEMLNGKSCIIQRDDPFIFEIPMLLLVAHVKSGQLDQVVEKYEEAMNLYSVISDGNGSGSGALLRAEAALCKGFFDEAALYCYKAAYLAESSQQRSLGKTIQTILSLVSICIGGKDGYEAAKQLLDKIPNENDRPGSSTELTKILIEKTIYFIMGEENWLQEHSDIQDEKPCIPWTMIVMGHLKEFYTCFRTERYTEAVEMGEKLALSLMESKSIYALIIVETVLSLCYAKNGKSDLSKDHFMKAFSIAMPDSFILPFIILWEQIQNMIWTWDKKCAEEFLKRETVIRISQISREFRNKWKSYYNKYTEEQKNL